jgi:hypothetical protein
MRFESKTEGDGKPLTDSTTDTKREMPRHTLATPAYRGGKSVRGAPEGFGSFGACVLAEIVAGRVA